MSNSKDSFTGFDLDGSTNVPNTSQLSPPRKRKRPDQDDKDNLGARKALKTQRKKERRKQRMMEDLGDCDETLKLNKTIGRMDSQILADHLAQKTKRFEPELSMVEMEDRRIPASAIADTTSWDKPRSTENLPLFLEEFGDSELGVAPKSNGSPHTLVVASAGVRAADLIRVLRKFQSKEALVAKFFAKHIKIREQIESCKSFRINIGVGTPQRISDLLEDGALSTKHLKRIVIDASHIDEKKRTVLDMRDTQVPLIKLLVREDLKERYGQKPDQIKLLFY